MSTTTTPTTSKFWINMVIFGFMVNFFVVPTWTIYPEPSVLKVSNTRSTRSNARERIEKKDDVKDKAPILEKSVAAVAVAAAVAALLEGDGRTR